MSNRALLAGYLVMLYALKSILGAGEEHNTGTGAQTDRRQNNGGGRRVKREGGRRMEKERRGSGGTRRSNRRPHCPKRTAQGPSALYVRCFYVLGNYS